MSGRTPDRPRTGRAYLHDAKEPRETGLSSKISRNVWRRLATSRRQRCIFHIFHRISSRRFFREKGGEGALFAEMVRRLHPIAALGVSPRGLRGIAVAAADRVAVPRRPRAVGLEVLATLALAPTVSGNDHRWSGNSKSATDRRGVIAESRADLPDRRAVPKRRK